jgi:hypothetical protein
MTIEQLKQMKVGKEGRTGGFQLVLKRARKLKELDKGYLQEVLFVDQTGEIDGEVLLEKRIPLTSGKKIHIVVCWLQDGEKGKRLYVDQWNPVVLTADEYEAMREKEKGVEPDEDTVASMCRNTLIRHFIEGYTAHHGKPPEYTEEYREILDRWLGYNLLGQ